MTLIDLRMTKKNFIVKILILPMKQSKSAKHYIQKKNKFTKVAKDSTAGWASAVASCSGIQN